MELKGTLSIVGTLHGNLSIKVMYTGYELGFSEGYEKGLSERKYETWTITYTDGSEEEKLVAML